MLKGMRRFMGGLGRQPDDTEANREESAEMHRLLQRAIKRRSETFALSPSSPSGWLKAGPDELVGFVLRGTLGAGSLLTMRRVHDGGGIAFALCGPDGPDSPAAPGDGLAVERSAAVVIDAAMAPRAPRGRSRGKRIDAGPVLTPESPEGVLEVEPGALLRVAGTLREGTLEVAWDPTGSVRARITEATSARLGFVVETA